MKIGIDLRPMQGETRFRGIGKTEEFFMSALSRLPERSLHHFTFYVDADIPQPEITTLFPDSIVRTIKSPKLGRKRYFRSFLPSFSVAQPSPDDIDVFLQFDAALGIPRSVLTVVIFYDLIPLLFRDIEKKSSKNIRPFRRLKDGLARHMYWQKYLRFIHSFQKADHLLAISESSKKDLLRYLPSISASRVTVVPLGVDHSFFVSSGKPSDRVRELALKPYILYVGGIDTRKNVAELVKVLYALKPAHPELRLIVVGKEFSLEDQLADRGWYAELHNNEAYAKDVLSTGFVTHNDLLYLYRQAQCFVFPSLYEGFGLPILEAMAAGCPVVAYDTSSIPEVAGDACILVEQDNNLSAAAERVLNNNTLRQDLIQRGKEHAARFTWDKTAKMILEKVVEHGNKA